jgi:hypothetical protein
MRTWTQTDLESFLDDVLTDVEGQLFYDIKSNPGMRTPLLSQLDVLTQVKARIYARIGTSTPSN